MVRTARFVASSALKWPAPPLRVGQASCPVSTLYVQAGHSIDRRSYSFMPKPDAEKQHVGKTEEWQVTKGLSEMIKKNQDLNCC